MNASRSEKIADVMKNIKALGKVAKKPTTLQYVRPGQGVPGLPQPIEGSFIMRILMYFVAALMLVGLILLGIDQWVTPIFQRTAGGDGYIPIPGMDTSEVFWTSSNDARTDITLGPLSESQIAARPTPLSSQVITEQLHYAITMDVMITDETPKNTGSNFNRVFFVVGSNSILSATNYKLIVELDRLINKVYIHLSLSDSSIQTITIDNVPIHTPFRIGVSVSPGTMEGYINGLLVKTIRIRSAASPIAVGTKIFQTDTIQSVPTGSTVTTPIALSTGIQVRNVRLFGYPVSTSEMKARMSDLARVSVYT